MLPKGGMMTGMPSMIGYSCRHAGSGQCSMPPSTSSPRSLHTVASASGGAKAAKWPRRTAVQPPIVTVGQPGGSIVPVGEGMGATQATWLVMSPTRAAGSLSIVTVAEPFTIMPGPPGTQDGSVQIVVVSDTRAAGFLPMVTVGEPEMMGRGKAGCGTGVGTRAAGWIGAWQWGAALRAPLIF